MKSAAMSSKPPSDELTRSVSSRISEFVAGFDYEQIPEPVRERGKGLILDAVGVALASTHYDFAHRTLTGISALAGSGSCAVIGMGRRLPLRDAVLMNGVLVHGLDYDDTHVDSAVHPTASAVPCALGMAEHIGATGRDLLAAYVLGVEVATRIGLAAPFGFHHFGFHPTGIAGHFSCALQAGWLLGLNPRQLEMAQGIVGSTAAASQEFLSEGAWNKRLHPGWAGVAGITAAYLARDGFIGPMYTYEGRYGLFRSHLHEKADATDYAKITAGLGEVWETAATAVKPFPICHLVHACADCALALRQKHKLSPDQIAEVRVLLPEHALHIVAEPETTKIRPGNSYDAKFSAQFVVAACLVKGQFGLSELESNVLSDTTILDLAAKVKCEADPDSMFPKYYSGGVVVSTKDGREFRHYESVNRGAGERALSTADIVDKFMANASMVMAAKRARELCELILDLDRHAADDVIHALAGQ